MVKRVLRFDVRQRTSLLLERIWKVEINKKFIAIMTKSLSRESDWIYLYDKNGRELLEMSFRGINDMASTEDSIVILPSHEDKLYIVEGPFNIRYFKIDKGYFFLRVSGRLIELCGSNCVIYDLEGNEVERTSLKEDKRFQAVLSIVSNRIIERCENKIVVSHGNMLEMLKDGKPLWRRRFIFGVSAIFFNDRCDRLAVFSEVNDLIYVMDIEKGKLVGVIELEERGPLEKLINFIKWKLGLYLHVPFSSVLWKENRLAVITWNKVLIFEA